MPSILLYFRFVGVPKRNGRHHVTEIATMALDLLSHVKKLEIPHLPGTKLKIRIGIHSGKLNDFAIGHQRFIFEMDYGR